MTQFYFITLAFCWGSAFLATKNIVDTIDPYWGALSRVVFGLLLFVIIFIVRRKSIHVPAKELWRPFLLQLLLISIPFMLMFWGQRFVPSGIGGIFNGTVPIWAFIAGAILLKGEDSFTWTRALGVGLGLAGMLTVMLPKLAPGTFSGSMMEFWGCVALMLMAVCYALGNVATKYIMVDHKTVSTEGNIFYQYVFAGIIMLIVALIFGRAPAVSDLTPKVLTSMAYVGMMSSAVAFLCLLQLIKRLGATRASAVTYLVPIIALIIDFAATGRVPGGMEFAGVALIFAGLFLIQKPVKKQA
ncbi:Permease of the drug/metabolite transporter (DMT) superfamily [Parelusimicrobium proximum]|uniref:DMT family transporter n=1 Tax=Parelusimicrobium proximum TaxID=3228953 RepID=UPI003D1779DD